MAHIVGMANTDCTDSGIGVIDEAQRTSSFPWSRRPSLTHYHVCMKHSFKCSCAINVTHTHTHIHQLHLPVFLFLTSVTAGTTVIFAYGDWREKKAMPGLPPSPTTGLRRRLAKQFTVVDVVEHNTTKLCCRCHSPTTEVKEYTRKRRDGTDVPKRGIRRCNSVQCGGLFWNRDLNAAINIRHNFIHAIMNNGQWHEKFKRPPPPPPPSLVAAQQLLSPGF